MYVQCTRCQAQNHPNATQCAQCGNPLPAAGAAGFSATNAPGFSGGTNGGASGGASSSGVASQPTVGQLIDGKYRVERILGEGGMGVVYVALDINADQRVVIKSILPQFANRGDFRERTLSEGKALAKIDHQNVVRFNSIINSTETNELYIVMQFIEGESLDRTLEKANAAGQKIPVTEVLRVFKQILDGVGAAHKENLIHRDLKPANVLVRAKDGVAKVMDFGIAKSEGATKGPTQAGGIVGSLFYMAPEQIKGARDLDKRLDIYALGIVLYELLTGVVPFDGETEYEVMTKHLTEPVPSVLLKRPDAPAWVDAVIAKATQKEREQRFQLCEEFRAMIDANDGGIAVPRSMTSYEAPATPGPMQPRAGTGTSHMVTPQSLASGSTSGSLGGVPYVTGSSQPMSVPTRSGGGKAAIALVALLLLGGGAVGAYTMTTGKADSGAAAKAPSKSKSSDDKRDHEKPVKAPEGDEAEQTPKKPTEPKKTLVSVDTLVGKWRTTTTKRQLLGVKVDDDEIEFKVADASEWDGAFLKDETLFRLLIEDKTIKVTAHFRPKPGPGKHFSRDALASCLVDTTEVDGKPLIALLKPNGILDVQLAAVDFGVNAVPGESEIQGCKPPKITGSVSADLKKEE